MALSGDGRYIVSGSDDGTVAVWDLQTGARLATLALDGQVTCLRWHPADRFLVVGDVIGNLYCLEYRQGVNPWTGLQNEFQRPALSDTDMRWPVAISSRKHS